MDAVLDKEQPKTVQLGRKIIRSVSPRGQEGSPSAYDYCSNGRHNVEDGQCCREVKHHNCRLTHVHRHHHVDIDASDSTNSNMLLSELSHYCRESEMKALAACNSQSNEGESQNCLGTESGLEHSKRCAMPVEYYEGSEESADNMFSSLYKETSSSYEGALPLDVENNALIWIAPPPEDEEYEPGITMGDGGDDPDDDDDHYVGGFWDLAPSSGSLSSSEFRNKGKTASEEQRKAMRAVVNGHFRVLVAQLLSGEGIQTEEGSQESWLDIVTALSLQAATLVKPDTSSEGGMDPGGYVKVKCVATGRRSESYVVKGIVCKRNVAHRRMMSRLKNPRLLLLGGSLEYQRVTNQLSSLDTILQQEQDHLSMAVAKIEAYHPDVLLVEKAVSRHAQECLLGKEISLVLNVKRPLLERIARCTGASIVSNSDNLTSGSAKVGHCELFHVQKYVEEHGSAAQGGKKMTKTLMFFEDCPKPLGCTILLMGSNGDELKKVKRAVQFAVFAAYHLALEISFLMDEGALPELCFKSPLSVVLPDKKSKSDRSISVVSNFVVPTSLQSQGGNFHAQGAQAFPLSSTPVSPHSDDTLHVSESYLTKPSPSESSVPETFVPWSASSSHVSSTENSPSSSPLRVQDTSMGDSVNAQPCTTGMSSRIHEVIREKTGKLSSAMTLEDFKQRISGFSVSLRKGYLETLSMVPSLRKLPFYDGSVSTKENNTMSASEASAKSPPEGSCGSPSLTAGHGVNMQMVSMDSNSDLHELHQGGEGQESYQEDFPPSPSDHQSILVSFSSSCLRKGTICERGHLFRIKYYGTFDKPLGRFLRDTIFDRAYKCPSCGEPKDAHIDCYTHQQGSLTISVHKQSQVLPGESEGKIWMWHRCLKCARVDGVPPATPRLVMSDAAWGLSFGKFLELSFSNHAAASRVASCGHSLHRDCLRFYGFGSMTACFRYSPVNVYSVYLPPSKLAFHKSGRQDWLQQEIHELAEKGEHFFGKACDDLHQIEERIESYSSGKVTEAKTHILEMEDLLLKQKDRFEAALENAASPSLGVGKQHADILELSCIRRDLFICSSLWGKTLQDLLNILKSPKPVIGFDTILVGDSIMSLKGISFASSKNCRFGDSKEISTVIEADLDGSNLVHIQGTGSLADVGARNQGNSLVSEKINPIHATGSAFDLEATAKVCNYSCTVNRLVGSSVLDEGSRGGSAEGYQPEEGPSGFVKNKMMEALIDSQSVPFPEAKVKDRLFIGSNSLGSSSLHIKGIDTDSQNLFDGQVGFHKSFSEDCFPPFRDLSATFEAAWTGRGHTVEGHAAEKASNEQDPPPCKSGQQLMSTSEGSGKGSGSEVSDESSTTSLSQEGGVEGVDLHLTSTLTSPAKAGEPSDIEGWVGAPFSSLCRPYSMNTQRPLTASPPRPDAQVLSTSDSAGPRTNKAAEEGVQISLPVGINSTVVSVFDDEPTSIIAYAIISQEHRAHVFDRLDKDKHKEKEREQKEKEKEKASLDNIVSEGAVFHPLQLLEGSSEEGDSTLKDRWSKSEESISNDQLLIDSLLHTKAMHVKVSFTDDTSQGNIRYTVTCYYAKQFDALRKKCCPNEMDFIRSLCRCKKWGAQGGKSNVFFAKTADDRFVVKQVTKTELESFITFAAAYFKYISDALVSGSPTCLAKILGIYQVAVKHGKAGKEVRMDLMVMENLLYGRQVTRVYDLKGSVRSRYIADATGKNAVLLDQNLLESMQTNPIFISNKAKRLLERAVWNDTAFLASVDVMDYSLLVGVDEEKRDLVLGIIDFMRQYTWDKHLETWVKASGILGGPKNATPTVISPKQYKKRFRKAMSTYFLMVPDQWSPLTVDPCPQYAEAPKEPSQ